MQLSHRWERGLHNFGEYIEGLWKYELCRCAVSKVTAALPKLKFQPSYKHRTSCITNTYTALRFVGVMKWRNKISYNLKFERNGICCWYLQWTFRIHVSSCALPLIYLFSARHIRDFPESSTCGEKVSVLVVTFPSGLIWNNEEDISQKKKSPPVPPAQNVLQDRMA